MVDGFWGLGFRVWGALYHDFWGFEFDMCYGIQGKLSRCLIRSVKHVCIYDPGSRFADPPPPPSPSRICVTVHTFSAYEGSKSDNCHEDRVPRRPIRVTVHIFQARLSREGAKAKAINRHEDRVTGPIPVTADPLQPYCNCPKATTVTKIVAPRSIKR